MAGRVITFWLLVFVSIAASADSLTGKVVKVVDGDTLYVLNANNEQHKIRLAGIDAPERKQATAEKSVRLNWPCYTLWLVEDCIKHCIPSFPRP